MRKAVRDPFSRPTSEPSELERPIVAAVVGTGRQLREAVDRKQLEEALRRKDIPTALDSIPQEPYAFLRFRLVEAMAIAFRVGAMLGLRQLRIGKARTREREMPPELRTAFDITNPNVGAWIETRTAMLVLSITDEQREAIRQLVHRAFFQGDLTVKQMARIIAGKVGLFPQWANAVMNYHVSLLTGGMHDDLAARLADRYADRLLRARGLNIARTEVLAAANAGKKESWTQAIGQRLLAPESMKIWVITTDSRTCARCLAQAGQMVPLNQPFSSGVDMPPLHPSCRCTADVIPPRV